ncbi:MAG: hypothetical protein ACREME_10770, partial [Gemmatimonadales bacterium]
MQKAQKGAKRRGRFLMWVGIAVVGLPLLLVGVLATPPATRVVVRRALPMLNEGLNGRIMVEEIGGSLLGRVRLGGLTVRGPAGDVLVRVERAELDYSIGDLLRGRFTIDPLILEAPIVRLVKEHPGEPYTLVQVFEGRGNGGDKPSGGVDVTIRDVAMRGGTLVVTVWREPADPRVEGPQPLDTVRLEHVDLRLPLLHYSSGARPDTARLALLEVDSARAHLTHPEADLFALRGGASLRGDSITIALETVQLPNSRFSADAWLVTAPPPGERRFAASARVAELTAGDIDAFIRDAAIPADWRLTGDVRAASQPSGVVRVESPNLDIAAAGGTVRGRITLVGDDDEWSARNTHLELAGIDLAALLRAFDVQSSLRGTVGGTVTAEGRRGTVDLQLESFTGYGVRGAATGTLRASGRLDALAFETRLAGDLGRVALSGHLHTGRTPALRQVRGELQRLDLAALDGRLPSSSLNARLEGDVVFGSLPRDGNLRLSVDSSTVRDAQIDTAAVIARLEGGLVTLDSLLVRAPGIVATGAGTFGLDKDNPGELTLEIAAPELAALEPLLTSLTGDTLDLAGAIEVRARAQGTASTYTLALDLEGDDVAVSGIAAQRVEAAASGTPDSLAWT